MKHRSDLSARAGELHLCISDGHFMHLEGKVETNGACTACMIEARTVHSGVLKGNNGSIWAQKGKDGAGL
jgi:hypothetical protein